MQNASARRPVLTLKAPAKVNLALAVGPPRVGDGFHPICSWMAPISLADELTITRLEDDRLSRYAILWHEDALRKTPIDWSITKDLAVRAHLLLEAEAGRPLPVQLKLEKRTPVGGGLGGGSSDAAAMLRGVNQLFDLGIGADRLRELAMKLGSDVAFFLGDGPMVVEGVGDRLASAAHAPGHLVLLFPEFGCATGHVYRAFDSSATTEMRDEAVREMASRGVIDEDALFNDLAAPAEEVAPGLKPLRHRATEIAGKPVHITGSGSTMFVVCGRETEAQDLAEELNEGLGGCIATTSVLV